MWFRKKQQNKRHHRRNVLDVKLRSDHVKALRARGLAVMIGVVFGTVFTLYVLWRSGEWVLDRLVYQNQAFTIQSVEVATDGEISVRQLHKWAGIRQGQNLMALDLSRVKRNLEMVPNVQSVSVERLLPKTLRIRVAERKPLARVHLYRDDPQQGLMMQPWLLDAEGAVMMPLEDRNRQVPLNGVEPPITVLLGVSQSELRLGRCVDSVRIRTALELLEAFNRSLMASQVKLLSVQVDVPGVLIAMTDSGSQVTFGYDEFEMQIQRWRQIHDESQRLHKSILTIDLAVRNNIPVRWVEANASEPGKASHQSRRGNV